MAHSERPQPTSFVEACAQRGGYVLWVLAINAVILTVYVMYFYRGYQPGQFWLIGMGVTLGICTLASAVTLVIVVLERVRERRARRRARMWADAMPYQPVRSAGEGGAGAQDRNGG
jgi:hypothetical protein